MKEIYFRSGVKDSAEYMLCQHVSIYGEFAEKEIDAPEYICDIKIKCRKCKKNFVLKMCIN